MRHLARRSDTTMPELAATGSDATEPCVDVLFAPPREIAATPGKMADLIHTVDALSRRVQPANVRSIRLTSAYLRMGVEAGEPPEQVKAEARRISVYMVTLTCLAVFAFVLAVGFLADADYGRRMLQQVEKLRLLERDNETALNGLASTDFQPGPFVASAPPSPPGASNAPSLPGASNAPSLPGASNAPSPPGVSNAPVSAPVSVPLLPPATAVSPLKYQGALCDDGHVVKSGEWQQPVTAKAMDLCRQKDDIRNRIALAYVGLADWNCWNYRFNWLRLLTASRESLSCGAPMGESSDASGEHQVDLRLWRSHETRVSASIAVMTGFLLPMLLGFLGGCAYVFRHFDEKLTTWSVEPHDGKHAWVRVLLAALLGGLVGMIWTSDDTVRIGGFSLSLAATAFFVGFSVEAVFTLIQSLIAGVFSTIRVPATNTAPPVITPGQVRRIAQGAASEMAARNNAATSNGSGSVERSGPDGGGSGAGGANAGASSAGASSAGVSGPGGSGGAASAGSDTAGNTTSGGTTPGNTTPSSTPASSTTASSDPASNTTAGPDTATATAAPPPTQASSTLTAITERLGQQRQVLGALTQLDAGSPIAANASHVAGAIDQLLQSIQPVLNAAPGAPAAAIAVQQAGKLLQVAENAGLPGLLADSVAALQGVATFAAPVISGIPGGPAGIIGGIVLGGLQLIGDEQQFQAMKTAMLRKPFNPSLPPPVPDATTALAALEASPLMSARVPTPKDRDFATALMQRILPQDTASTPTPASQLALSLLQPNDKLGLAGHFESPAELAMAIEEYRSGVVFTGALTHLTASVAVPDAETGAMHDVSLRTLAEAVAALQSNPLASAAIENAMAVTDALRKLKLDPRIASDLVTRALAQVPQIVATARQVKVS